MVRRRTAPGHRFRGRSRAFERRPTAVVGDTLRIMDSDSGIADHPRLETLLDDPKAAGSQLVKQPSRCELSEAQIVQSIIERNRTMARTKRSRRSYSAGEWGRNRVRVFPDPKTGLYQLEWRENGRRLTRSLRHRDWARAKRQADAFAAGFVGPDLNGKAEAEPEPLTLGKLFDIYGEEVTPTKAGRVQRRDRVATGMFLDFLGRDRRPETLSQRDWDRFIRDRRAGRVGPSGKPVGNRTIEWDLTFLMAVLNWAARSKDEQGRPLLDRNPLKGLRKPRGEEPQPGRPHRGRVPGAPEGVEAGRVAVPRRARARARDRAPDRRDSQPALV